MHVQLCEDMRPSAPAEVYNLLRGRKTRPNQGHTYIHTYMRTYIRTLDNAHNSQAQRLNLRRWQSLGGKRTVDINDEQTDGVSSRDAEPLKLHSGSGSGSHPWFLDEIWLSWNCWEIRWIAVTCSKQMGAVAVDEACTNNCVKSAHAVFEICGICVPPTVTYLPYRVSGSTLTAVGRSRLLARCPGTHSRILSAIQRAAQTVLDVYLKRTCSARYYCIQRIRGS